MVSLQRVDGIVLQDSATAEEISHTELKRVAYYYEKVKWKSYRARHKKYLEINRQPKKRVSSHRAIEIVIRFTLERIKLISQINQKADNT